MRGRTNGRRVEARENSYTLNIAWRTRSSVSFICWYDALDSWRPVPRRRFQVAVSRVETNEGDDHGEHQDDLERSCTV